MSTEEFKTVLYLPAQAAAETEATIVSWKVAEGAVFAKGDILAEAESAKASFEFDAPCNGKVVKLLAAEGDEVPFEKPVIEIETSDESVKEVIRHVSEAEPAAEMAVAAPKHEDSSSSEQITILGIGGYLPERIVKTREMLEDFPNVTAEYMVGVTGIEERRWAAEDEKPSSMAYKAAIEAIKKSDLKPADIDAIVLATGTPDVAMPSTACILQDMLDVRGIPAFDLNAACSGWLYGLTVARGLLLSGVGTNILVVGVELQSRLLDKTDRGTYFLFGDGAGAAVVSNSGRGHVLREQVLVADSKGLNMARRHTAGYLVESEADPWVRLDGHSLFRFATGSFSTLIRQVIEKSGWTPNDVRWVVPHQANGRILKAAASRCGVAFERFYLNIERVGNTSSASIPLALLEIERGIQKGDKIVLCSVGAGITAASVAIEW
ncbi:MAG: beta-ketoacyl-ACP synthase III [Chitinivibrionales bacterium]|nr:beta-ketoacyl-ACP synthase III [Chitinivibrionales bacterium]MBD3355806.1 beta-ketoacyl-ACP synthase III [Chitinivibrionales bacterium]